jgi:hypothetical protein
VDEVSVDDAPAQVKPTDGGLVEKLLDKFPPFDPGWDDTIKAKWFASFEQFMKAAKVK